MNVKHGAQGFSTRRGLSKASRNHFPLRLICAGRKEVLTIVGHFTFPVSTVAHRRAATKKIIKINPPDEITCTALTLRDEEIILSGIGYGIAEVSGIDEWLLLCSCPTRLPSLTECKPI